MARARATLRLGPHLFGPAQLGAQLAGWLGSWVAGYPAGTMVTSSGGCWSLGLATTILFFCSESAAPRPVVVPLAFPMDKAPVYGTREFAVRIPGGTCGRPFMLFAHNEEL